MKYTNTIAACMLALVMASCTYTGGDSTTGAGCNKCGNTTTDNRAGGDGASVSGVNSPDQSDNSNQGNVANPAPEEELEE